MGASIYFFAAPQDYYALSEYCRSIGLRFYPILMQLAEEALSDDPSRYPFAYLTSSCREDLHPYGDPLGIGPATDPLLELMKPYFKNNTLVIGRLHCSDDVPEFTHVTKPLFLKIRNWIRERWEKLPTGQYIGQEAKILREHGAELAYFPPIATRTDL